MSFALTNLVGFGAGELLKHTFIGSNIITADQATYTFTAEPVGTPASDRLVIVDFMSQLVGTPDLTSATIGAVTASRLQCDGTNTTAGLIYARLAAGETADIVLNFAATMLRCGIGVRTLTGQQSDTPFHTDNPAGGADAARTVTLNVPGVGVAIVAAATGNTTGIAWTNADENYDITPESGSGFSGATFLTPIPVTGRIITADQCRAIVGATWR